MNPTDPLHLEASLGQKATVLGYEVLAVEPNPLYYLSRMPDRE